MAQKPSLSKAALRVLGEATDVQRYDLHFSNGNTTPAHLGFESVIGLAKQYMANNQSIRWADVFRHTEAGKKKEGRVTADGHLVRPSPQERKETQSMSLVPKSTANDLFSAGQEVVVEPKDYNRRVRLNMGRFRFSVSRNPAFQTLDDFLDHLKKQYTDVTSFAFYTSSKQSGGSVGRIMST